MVSSSYSSLLFPSHEQTDNHLTSHSLESESSASIKYRITKHNTRTESNQVLASLPDGESLVRAEKGEVSTNSAIVVGKTLGSDIRGAVVVEDGPVVGIRGICVSEQRSSAEVSFWGDAQRSSSAGGWVENVDVVLEETAVIDECDSSVLAIESSALGLEFEA